MGHGRGTNGQTGSGVGACSDWAIKLSTPRVPHAQRPIGGRQQTWSPILDVGTHRQRQFFATRHLMAIMKPNLSVEARDIFFRHKGAGARCLPCARTLHPLSWFHEARLELAGHVSSGGKHPRQTGAGRSLQSMESRETPQVGLRLVASLARHSSMWLVGPQSGSQLELRGEVAPRDVDLPADFTGRERA